MLNISFSVRLWITAGILLGSTGLLHTLRHGEVTVAHQPLANLPYSLGRWTGEERPLEPQIVEAVNVSDYTNRVYLDPKEPPVQLYIGYYASQKSGDTIHSPKNCLPGSGWDPIQSGDVRIPLESGQQITVNEYVIQRDLNKQMVFYWYQSQGRVMASEYSAKFWMVADAIAHNRTDGALVRIITPMKDGEAATRTRLVHFTQILFPHLDGVLPN
jgi:EpsI family protein